MDNTIKYFKEISTIPRESGNENEIANYIVEFAKKNKLEYKKDNNNNVIIKRYIDNKEPIILQAHLDMVCEKDDIEFDFKKDPIEVIEENGYLKANHTTLGADNGIGVAQILNIFENTNCSIEAIFTTQEETTMDGSINIDLRDLKGKEMINLDGFSSDTILIESASFTDIDILFKNSFINENNNFYEIKLSGLDGGHSGTEIDNNKGNSIKLLSELLSNIEDIQIASFTGGTKINVIPNSSKAIIKTNKNIKEIINTFIKNNKNNYKKLTITTNKTINTYKTLSKEDTKLFLNSLNNITHGVINKNKRGVTTSSNLAQVDLEKGIIRIGLRSSNSKEREKAIKELDKICNNYKYQLNITGYQPGFNTNENTNLIKELIDSYKDINNTSPKIESIHVSVEAGIIKEKIPNLEVAIISPNIIGAHTTSEKVEIDSIFKCNKWLLNYLNKNTNNC